MGRRSRISMGAAAMIIIVVAVVTSVTGLGLAATAEAPIVQITSPQAGESYDNTPFLEYTVSDRSATVVVKLCGRERDIRSGQSFWILGPGPHTVRVEATNTQGLTGFDEVQFYVPCNSCDVDQGGGDHSDDPPGNPGTGSGGGSGGGTTPTTVPQTPTTTLPPAKKAVSFSDVSQGAWYKRYIDMLVTRGILSGYPDGTFRPHKNVSRAEFSKMLCLAKDWAQESTPTAPFSDVPVDHWACTYVDLARANGIIMGYPDGTFGPARNITRAEIAASISRVLDLQAGTGDFKDIAAHWARDQICACFSAGVLNGYGDKTFKPDNPATRAEAAKMVAQMFDH